MDAKLSSSSHQTDSFMGIIDKNIDICKGRVFLFRLELTAFQLKFSYIFEI